MTDLETPAAIYAALADVEAGLPVDALRAASARRAEMTPLLIAEIERIAALAEPPEQDEMKGFFAFFLLAEWRETAACRPILRLLRRPLAADIFGDGLFETCARVLASVFDGDLEPMFETVLDREVDDMIRAEICAALTLLAVRGAVPRDRVAQFAVRAFDFLEKEPSIVWCGWAEMVEQLGLAHLRPKVERAFREGWIDDAIMSQKEFAQGLDHALAHPDAPWRDDADSRTLWGDTVDELSDWYGFSQEYRQEEKERSERLAAQAARGETLAYESLAEEAPYVNELRNVGRNDPCPCGSGKKYKKCCLA